MSPHAHYSLLAAIFRGALERVLGGAQLPSAMGAAASGTALDDVFLSIADMMAVDLPLAQATMQFRNVFDPVLQEMTVSGRPGDGREFLACASRYCDAKALILEAPRPDGESLVFLVAFARALSVGVPLTRALRNAAAASPEGLQHEMDHVACIIETESEGGLRPIFGASPFLLPHVPAALELGFAVCAVDTSLEAAAEYGLRGPSTGCPPSPRQLEQFLHHLSALDFRVEKRHEEFLSAVHGSVVSSLSEAAAWLVAHPRPA